MTVDTNKKLGVTSPEEHAEAGAAFINIDTYRFHVKAVTLNNLLIENDSPREIDFLSLDVEGSELNVLKGLDLNFFVVKYILIETRDFEVIDLYLNPFGYKFVDKFSDQDFLFKRI
jgi:FkbM family methyltransferase